MVPRRIEERVGHIGLTPPLTATLRTLHEVPLLVPGERAHARIVRPEILDVWELHRQILLGHRYDPALLAVDDGNRRSPVALPRDAPVVQPVLHARRREPPPTLDQPGDDLSRALGSRHPIECSPGHEP